MLWLSSPSKKKTDKGMMAAKNVKRHDPYFLIKIFVIYFCYFSFSQYGVIVPSLHTAEEDENKKKLPVLTDGYGHFQRAHAIRTRAHARTHTNTKKKTRTNTRTHARMCRNANQMIHYKLIIQFPGRQKHLNHSSVKHKERKVMA